MSIREERYNSSQVGPGGVEQTRESCLEKLRQHKVGAGSTGSRQARGCASVGVHKRQAKMAQIDGRTCARMTTQADEYGAQEQKALIPLEHGHRRDGVQTVNTANT